MSIINRFGSSPEEHLRSFFNERESFPFRLYPALVVDNNDPQKIGRVRVRVYGFHGDAIPDQDCPWAIQDQGFAGSMVGSFIVPPVGAVIRVYFDGGEITSPVYTTKVLDRNNLPSSRDDDYPNTIVLFETDDGEYLKINMKERETIYRHSTGAMLKIDKNGDTLYKTDGKLEIDAGGKVSVNAPQIQFPPGNVTPGTTGPFNCLPNDPITGMPHAGTLETRIGI